MSGSPARFIAIMNSVLSVLTLYSLGIVLVVDGFKTETILSLKVGCRVIAFSIPKYYKIEASCLFILGKFATDDFSAATIEVPY